VQKACSSVKNKDSSKTKQNKIEHLEHTAMQKGMRAKGTKYCIFLLQTTEGFWIVQRAKKKPKQTNKISKETLNHGNNAVFQINKIRTHDKLLNLICQKKKEQKNNNNTLSKLIRK
jgi:hypothetical protein